MAMAQPAVSSQGSSARKLAQPHSVPTVPGALGESPLPKPKATQCAGSRSMKRAPPTEAMP